MDPDEVLVENDYSLGREMPIAANRERGASSLINAWFPVVLGMVIVALESQERFGSNHTSHPLRVVFEAIFGHINNAKWGTIHHLIRKAGHCLLYGPFGLVWLRAWWQTLPHSHFLSDALLALLGIAAVGCADEWHQSFNPNRTASVWDVLLDCCGAIALQLIVYAYMRVYRPKQLAHAD